MEESHKSSFVTIRRILGISALVFWAIVIVPWIILPLGDRLAWQLQNWSLIPATVFTTMYVLLLIIRVNKDVRRDENKIPYLIRNWSVCCMAVIICVACFLVAILKADYKVWSNGKYVIYGYKVSDNENGGFRSPSIFVFYERKGIVDDRLGLIGDKRQYLFDTGDMSRIRKVDYTIYKPLDLIKEEMDYMPYDSDSVRHLTSFYRLSDRDYYEQIQNDSLLSLINQYNQRQFASSVGKESM
jgi:hypothetical protein